MNTFLANLYLRAITVRDREEGQTMAEYGIILALIAVVCIVAVALLGGRIDDCIHDHRERRLGHIERRWWNLSRRAHHRLTSSSTSMQLRKRGRERRIMIIEAATSEGRRTVRRWSSSPSSLPILLLLVFGIIQFGILFNHYLTLTDAVRAGARQAAVSRTLPEPRHRDRGGGGTRAIGSVRLAERRQRSRGRSSSP